jgi:hypothetical protein
MTNELLYDDKKKSHNIIKDKFLLYVHISHHCKNVQVVDEQRIFFRFSLTSTFCEKRIRMRKEEKERERLRE